MIIFFFNSEVGRKTGIRKKSENFQNVWENSDKGPDFGVLFSSILYTI